MIKKTLKFFSIPLTLTLILAGCGGSSTEPAAKPESTAAAQTAPKAAPSAPAKETVSVKFGGTDKVSLKHLPIFLSSFGKEEALKVEFTEYSSGTKATAGLLGKEIDFGFLQVEHVLRDTSGELRIIGLITRYPGSALLVDSKYKDKIKSVKDLAGQKVGVSSLGAASHQFLLTLLAKNGVDAKSVNIMPVGLNAGEVLGQEKVAAMVTIEPYITRAIDSGKGSALVDARKAEGTKQVYGADQWPWIALVTRADVITSNPDLVGRVAKSTAASLKGIAGMSVDEIMAQTPKEMVTGSEAEFRKVLQANQAQFSVDGKLTSQLLMPVWSNMQEIGAVPKDKALSMESVVESKFMQ